MASPSMEDSLLSTLQWQEEEMRDERETLGWEECSVALNKEMKGDDHWGRGVSKKLKPFPQLPRIVNKGYLDTLQTTMHSRQNLLEICIAGIGKGPPTSCSKIKRPDNAF